MAASADLELQPLSLELLPTDPLLLILSFLDYRDLMSCCYVSRRLNQLSSYDPLWRRHCKKYWLLSEAEKSQRNKNWKAIFIDVYADLGRYIQCYAALKKAWDDLKKYLLQRCPRMINSLKESVQEEDLDAVEVQIGCKLPDDYRCSFRIHNGQKLVVPGLMGSMAFSNHYRSEDLLDIDTAADGFQQRLGLTQCLPLTFCIHTGVSQYMALESVEGRNYCEIFYQCPDQMAHNPSAIDMFITGSSYLEWFTSYVNNVVTGGYPIIRDQIFRYVHDKDCVATTGDITVSVSTSFLPELSSVHPPHYFFTYRIRIEMSKDALPEKACQLDSRYWRITNAEGDVEEVQGPGVVGEFPIISPGRVYEYTSCTTFATTTGYMEGYYTFHCLYYKDKFFNVTIPRFHMVCPKFKVSIPHVNVMAPGLDAFKRGLDRFVEEKSFTGEFPIISPGRVYEYTSCTTFATTTGYMEGYYTFHCLYYKDIFFKSPFLDFIWFAQHSKVSIARMETNRGILAYAMDEFGYYPTYIYEDDSTRTYNYDYEDLHMALDRVPAPSGRCPRQT